MKFRLKEILLMEVLYRYKIIIRQHLAFKQFLFWISFLHRISEHFKKKIKVNY